MIFREKKPTFSIVVPVYNAEKYLDECLNSILRQSYSDFEVILVDDGSNDFSLDICRRYECSDRRVRVISKENGGVSSARNAGIEAARGEYITFIDADDWILEGSLEFAAAQIEQHGSDFISGQITKISQKKTFTYKKMEDGHEFTGECVRHLGGTFIRLDIIRDNRLKFIDALAYSEDRVFLCEVIQYCRTVTTCSRDIYIYRISDSSVTNSVNGIMIMENQFRAAKHLFRMSRNPRFAKYRKQLISNAHRTIKWGIYAIVKHSPNKQYYNKMRNMFFNLFSNECEHPHMTYYKLIFTRHYLVYKQAIAYNIAFASNKLRMLLF